jgi:hypothetical protein
MNLKTKKPFLERIRERERPKTASRLDEKRIDEGTFTRSDFFNWIDRQEA